MADPLSITTGIITLITTVVQVGKRLHDIKKSIGEAPDVISSIINKVSDLHIALEACQLAATKLSNANTGITSTANLGHIVDRVRDILSDLQGKIDVCWSPTTTAGSSAPGPAPAPASVYKLAKRKWLKEKDDVIRLRDELQRSKASLGIFLHSIQM